jgi:hypothetical protein
VPWLQQFHTPTQERVVRDVGFFWHASSGDYASGGWSARIFCITNPVASLGWK